MMLSAKRYTTFAIILGILIATCLLPIEIVHASNSRIQNISITKLIDDADYKETFFVVTTSEDTYHILSARASFCMVQTITTYLKTT